MKYLKPKSLTWWASFAPLLAGLLVASAPLHGFSALVDTVNNMTGGIPSFVMINAGLAGIGVRAAIK